MQFFSPQRPDDAFTPFVAQMLRAVASGVGCSYTQVSSDFSQSNYSSSRLELIETRAHYRGLQQYIIERLCQPVYEKWMEMAVMAGELRVSGFDMDPDRYYESKWVAPAAQFVDPQKEAEAYKSLIRSGIMTLSQVIALTSLALFWILTLVQLTRQANHKTRRLKKRLILKTTRRNPNG
jgi:lambda family phage portal protein